MAATALIWSGFGEVANLSASSRFFGALAAMAWRTAAMKAALSKVPGLAVLMVSALAASAWACLWSAGGTAAAWAFLASVAGAG